MRDRIPMGGEYTPAEVQGVLDRTARRMAECPAWEDGVHCFVAEERNDFGMGREMVNGHDATHKVCACGAEIKRRATDTREPGSWEDGAEDDS